MTKNELVDSIRPKGNYTTTDLALYSDITASKIKAALTTLDPALMYPIFSVLELKDSSLGSEIGKRIDTMEGKYFIHNLNPDFDDSITEIILATLDATLFGYGVVELFLDSNGNFCYERVDKEFFYFENKKLFLKANNKKFEPKEPRYIVFRKKPALLKVIWILYAKHFVLSHYLKFTEFLGVPPIVTNASSSDADTISAIASQIKKISSASYAVFGPQDTVKVLEGRGNQADFLEFVRYCDAEVAKIVNGSVLSSNVSKTGSFAQSKIQDDNRYEILAKDAKWAVKGIKKAFKNILTPIDINIQVEKDKDLLQRAQILQIVSPLGYSISAEDIAKEFDLPTPSKKTASNNKFLSQNKKEMPLDVFDTISPNKKIEDEIENAVVNLIDGCNSFDDLFSKISKQFNYVKLDALEEALQKAIANSEILGFADG